MMVAEGKLDIHVADALGYTPARVRQLKQDPSFRELVAYYTDQIHEGSLGDEVRFQEKLRSAGEQALDELNDRLEDPNRIKGIATAELRNIVTVAADRTVAPPKAIANAPMAPAHITLNFGTKLTPKEKVITQVWRGRKMTIENWDNCCGTHFGSNECPYIFAPCIICGAETIYACSDCAINSRGKQTVHVCGRAECQNKHERETHNPSKTHSPASPA